MKYTIIPFKHSLLKIPTNISHCTELRVLDLYSNTLIGQLSSLLDINILWFDTNNLIGTIPSWIGNFSSLYGLYIGGNNFQGSIPNELGRLTGLQAFSIAANNLSGMVPPSIYNISSITIFGLHEEILPNVGVILPNLEQFQVDGNKFTGNIPASFSNASRLSILDLPENCLNGTIPAESLGSLQSLVRLNLGANRLETSNTGDLNFISFLANCTTCALAFIIAMLCFIVARSMLKKPRGITESSRSYRDWKLSVSYSDLVESTNKFCRENLIGSGSFGSVYKGVLPSDGSVVAVKHSNTKPALNLQQQGAFKSFINECEALRSVRHRNLLKIITACSSIDNQQ
ncbi:hypothetical protein DVH24_004509 [Malus domestica]|uniref:Protein kinase domain-containing protein n=1 Tax=Malus domestica TaxID=3750 RepID=A0A498IEP9_MALDO|nr:hypothetical protein DVH24_004509 [Malus domestica]